MATEFRSPESVTESPPTAEEPEMWLEALDPPEIEALEPISPRELAAAQPIDFDALETWPEPVPGAPMLTPPPSDPATLWRPVRRKPLESEPTLPAPPTSAPVHRPLPDSPVTPTASPPATSRARAGLRPVHAPDPPEPRGWVRPRISITVVVLLTVDSDGRILSADVHRPSGHAPWDQHACQWALATWRFPVTGSAFRTLVPFHFVP